MNRTMLIASFVLFIASDAYAQSDKEILEALRASITEIYLKQLPNDLPESWQNSGLSPSDKERLIRQLANDGATCFVDAAVGYAALHEVPLSDFISDELTVSIDGDTRSDFEQLLNTCILAARQAAGLSE